MSPWARGAVRHQRSIKHGAIAGQVPSTLLVFSVVGQPTGSSLSAAATIAKALQEDGRFLGLTLELTAWGNMLCR